MNNDKIKLVFATNNAHKLRELREILGTGYELLSLADIGCHEDIPEDGATLEENSLAKAQYVFDHYGYDCFADDTGLEVDALGGEPGVHSARYAEGTDHDSEANMRKLLAKLGNNNNRKARFRTIITLIRRQDAPSASPRTDCFCGEVEGTIALEKHGTEGFGYDPIFIPRRLRPVVCRTGRDRQKPNFPPRKSRQKTGGVSPRREGVSTRWNGYPCTSRLVRPHLYLLYLIDDETFRISPALVRTPEFGHGPAGTGNRNVEGIYVLPQPHMGGERRRPALRPRLQRPLCLQREGPEYPHLRQDQRTDRYGCDAHRVEQGGCAPRRHL